MSPHESSERVGGQVLLTHLLPGREDFGGTAMNLHREATRAGAQIVTRSTLGVDEIRSIAPDVVIVATVPPLRIPEFPCH